MDKITNYEMANVVNEVAEPIEVSANEHKNDAMLEAFLGSVGGASGSRKKELNERLEGLEEICDELDAELEKIRDLMSSVDDIRYDVSNFCSNYDIDTDDAESNLHDAYYELEHNETELENLLEDYRTKYNECENELESLEDEEKTILELYEQTCDGAFLNACKNLLLEFGVAQFHTYAEANDIMFNQYGEIISE